jgi:sarcosine oxidase subunit alpha
METLTDIDLSAEAFAYLGVRQGQVAGAAATVLRVGFVGELGYEIHVPAQHGPAVWTKLIHAGQAQGIRPFGVEAQRLLRLEKGHLIVSQDTDALTHPHEADLAWAIGKDKPFFVGQRSINVMNKQPQTRRLVGIAFDEKHDGPLPEECHLIIDGKDMAGRVTSIAHRSTLGHALGLAFVRPDQAQPGTPLQVRTDGGRLVQARVAAIPFYDPQNQRQN